LLAVTYIGAGIYEEVLFRLCLLPLCFGFFRLARLEKNWAAVLAILSTSLAFSLAHYVGATGEPFQLFSFAFRTLAGLVFAALFVLRGFGISVGCHAAYDLLVGVMLQL
jgi:membrane protease YdiL (CAAX protease family)